MLVVTHEMSFARDVAEASKRLSPGARFDCRQFHG
jgi:ABC-type polar amino acid transport system ATPase subunit